MSKSCWLRDGCPCRTGACSSCGPDDDGCPVYRWFRDKFIVRCKDCKFYCYYGLEHETVSECLLSHEENPAEDWFCSDGERK